MAAAWVGGNKTPPYSIYAEKALLSGLLGHPEVLAEVRSILPDGRVFFREQHAALYEAILELGRRDRDGGTTAAAFSTDLTELLSESGRLAAAGGERFITELAGEQTAPAQTVTHARTVADKAKLRHLINLVSEILSDAYGSGEGYEPVLLRTHERLKELFETLPQAGENQTKNQAASPRRRSGASKRKGKSKRQAGARARR